MPDDDLPSYDQSLGPNSRFGRWKGWVEKRAAERYVDVDPQERERRRDRGWGDTMANDQIDTNLPPSYPSDSPIVVSPPPGQMLEPSHLCLHNFGSRFLPHAKSPIHSLLPILGGRFLLIATQDGLSMLDVFPLSNVEGTPQIEQRGHWQDAIQRVLWRGESVYQLSLLEETNESSPDAPQGVVLALVGVEPSDAPNDRDKDNFRCVRMYNLSSLASLASWMASQKDARPVELQKPPGTRPHSMSKRHRRSASLAKGIKALMIDNSPMEEHRLPIGTPSASPSKLPVPARDESDDSVDSQWDIVDEMPLRWATDYVPLAASGTKLDGVAVNFFELWHSNLQNGIGRTLLAIATKSQIFLYDTPRGERAFRFVKEFYTPLPARKLTFVLQSANDQPHADGQKRSRISAPTSLNPDNNVSLFILFDKKAGTIRLCNSVVGELEMYDEPSTIKASNSFSRGASFRRSVSPMDLTNYGNWSVPAFCSLPQAPQPSSPTPTAASLFDSRHHAPARPVYIVSRGHVTHILPFPLPNPLNSLKPLAVITWQLLATKVIPRICWDTSQAPFLQLIAIGEGRVEVQEMSTTLSWKGKGKDARELGGQASADVGIDSGFLCCGRSWMQLAPGRTPRFQGLMNPSLVRGQVLDRSEEWGVYGWCQKDSQDWRIFWLGDADANAK